MELPPDEIIRNRARHLGIKPDELKYLIDNEGSHAGYPSLTNKEISLLESYRSSRKGARNSRDDRKRRSSRSYRTSGDPEATKLRMRPQADGRRKPRQQHRAPPPPLDRGPLRKRDRERQQRQKEIKDGKEDLLIVLDQIDEFHNVPHKIKLDVAYQEYTGDLSEDIEKSKRVLREYLQRTGLAAEPVMAIGVRDPRVVMADPVIESGVPILLPEPGQEPELEPELELEQEPEQEPKQEERDLLAEQIRLGREANYPDLPMRAGENIDAYFRRLNKHYKKLKKQGHRRKSCCGSRPVADMKKKNKNKQTKRRKPKKQSKRKKKEKTRGYKRLR